MPIISAADLAASGMPIVVCVSADPGVQERVVRQLGGGGVVLMCPDLGALRRMLSDDEDGLGVPAGRARGDLFIDAPDHRVVWRGKPLPLTRLECELVARLGTEPLRVWTYERLFSTVWGGTYLGDNSILHSAVKRLRRKLRAVDNDLAIETVRGVGYRLLSP